MGLIKNNINKQPVIFTDSPFNDGFGRLRVSNPITLVDSIFEYGTNPLFWQSAVTGATITHIPNESAIRLSGNTTSGSVAIRQTYEYYRYSPGKSQQVIMTGVLGAKKTNVVQRIGLFDGKNGLFFEQDGSNLKVVRRTNVTGTPVDIAVNQSSWNIDKLDGTTSSLIKINTSNALIFIIDFEWLGVGRVRFGFNIDGITYYCHQMLHSNNLSTVYMSTGNLPIRYELRNTGTVASPTVMYQLCSVVITEGGVNDPLGITHSVNMGTTSKNVTATRTNIISIRPKLTFNGVTNRGLVIPDQITIQTNADLFYEIVHGGSITNALVWNSAGNNSNTEFNITGTTVTGGEIIDSGYLPTGNNVINLLQNIRSKMPLTLDINGINPTNFSLVGTSPGGTVTVLASMRFKEVY